MSLTTGTCLQPPKGRGYLLIGSCLWLCGRPPGRVATRALQAYRPGWGGQLAKATQTCITPLAPVQQPRDPSPTAASLYLAPPSCFRRVQTLAAADPRLAGKHCCCAGYRPSVGRAKRGVIDNLKRRWFLRPLNRRTSKRNPWDGDRANDRKARKTSQPKRWRVALETACTPPHRLEGLLLRACTFVKGAVLRRDLAVHKQPLVE